MRRTHARTKVLKGAFFLLFYHHHYYYYCYFFLFARARARIAGNLDLASRSERFLCAHGAEELVDRVSWLMYVALLGQLRNGRQTNNLVYEMNGLATSPVTEPVNDEFYDEFRRVSGSGL